MAIGLGATRVIVRPIGFACALDKAPAGAVARVRHAFSLLVARQLVHDADRLEQGPVDLRIVPSLCPLDISPYDYSAAAVLISRAKADTRRWLEQGGLERVGTPGQLREHRD